MPSPAPEPPSSVHYYVYFRADPALEARTRETLERLLAEVARRTGVRGRLLRKSGEPHLWMEVYAPVADPAAFEPALAQAVAELGLERLVAAGSQRRIERFVEA